MVIPADLIMCVIGRIASGWIVHDDHSAEFKQGAAYAGYISGVDGYFSENLSHIGLVSFPMIYRTQAQPCPLRGTMDLVSFSWSQASSMRAASFSMPELPQIPP